MDEGDGDHGREDDGNVREKSKDSTKSFSSSSNLNNSSSSSSAVRKETKSERKDVESARDNQDNDNKDDGAKSESSSAEAKVKVGSGDVSKNIRLNDDDVDKNNGASANGDGENDQVRGDGNDDNNGSGGGKSDGKDHDDGGETMKSGTIHKSTNDSAIKAEYAEVKKEIVADNSATGNNAKDASKDGEVKKEPPTSSSSFTNNPADIKRKDPGIIKKEKSCNNNKPSSSSNASAASHPSHASHPPHPHAHGIHSSASWGSHGPPPPHVYSHQHTHAHAHPPPQQHPHQPRSHSHHPPPYSNGWSHPHQQPPPPPPSMGGLQPTHYHGHHAGYQPHPSQQALPPSSHHPYPGIPSSASYGSHYSGHHSHASHPPSYDGYAHASASASAMPPPYGHPSSTNNNSNKQDSKARNSSNASTASDGGKKRLRSETIATSMASTGGSLEESRDDAPTTAGTTSSKSGGGGGGENRKDRGNVDGNAAGRTADHRRHLSTDSTASTSSMGEFSMNSLRRVVYGEDKEASSPKRRKGPIRNQNIHRTTSTLSTDLNQDGQLPLLHVSSTLSEGKMILKNLSINSSASLRQSYSAEIAELCKPSPTNDNNDETSTAQAKDGTDTTIVDLGKTPRKRNTSEKKLSKDAASVVFRLDKSIITTPSTLRLHGTDDDSPTMMDLIGGADTPTTGLLLRSMENTMTDESSLNRHLRGQSFTPLPHVAGGIDDGLGFASSGHFGLTPQLSWTINGSPLGGDVAEPSPRFGFELLNSTRSRKNPLSSPRSFWKDDIMDENDSDSGKKDKEKKNVSVEKAGHDMNRFLSMLSPTNIDVSMDDTPVEGRAQSPIPPYYDKRSERHDKRAPSEDKMAPSEAVSDYAPKTPLRSRPAPQASHASPQVGHHPPHHGSPWPGGGDYRRPGYTQSPHPSHHAHHSHHPSITMSPFENHYGEHRRDHGHPGYGMYPPSHHYPQHPYQNDRVRNLRGRVPPTHHMPPPHYLPPPTYHHTLTSPLVGYGHQRGRSWHQHHGGDPHHLDMSSASKRKCVQLKPPIPSKFQGDIEKFKDAQVPEFNNLVNFPGNMSQKQSPNVPNGMRCCVMCGQACQLSIAGKNKQKDKSVGESSNNSRNGSNGGSGCAVIPTQNKGLCTMCDVSVWIVTQSGLEIKWCKGCKNFRPWAAFGDKGLATKCVRCRERQREKYAVQKKEKEKARGNRPALNAS